MITDEQAAELRAYFAEHVEYAEENLRDRGPDFPAPTAHDDYYRTVDNRAKAGLALIVDWRRLRAFYRESKARELAELMSGISEEQWCAVWMSGLERDLWAIVQGGERHYGMSDVDESDVEKLRELSREIDGWVVWNDDREGPETVYVPMTEWLAALDAARADAAKPGGAR